MTAKIATWNTMRKNHKSGLSRRTEGVAKVSHNAKASPVPEVSSESFPSGKDPQGWRLFRRVNNFSDLDDAPYDAPGEGHVHHRNHNDVPDFICHGLCSRDSPGF